jgi:DNA polymerase I-like protein with 3'-5' exonuclease and polymerase domains
VLAKNDGGADGVRLYQKFFGTGAVNEKSLRRVGKKVRDSFATRIPGYAKLLEDVGKLVEKYGKLPGLDGRVIPSRAEHSALNFLIQSAGAIICKRWLCDAFDDLSSRYKHGWDGDFVFILWVHDEIQVACREEIAEEVGEALVRHARAAGEPYGFRVPLDSKYSVGLTWADTH